MTQPVQSKAPSPFLRLQASLPARGMVCCLLGVLANVFILESPVGWGWGLLHLVAVLAMAYFVPRLFSTRLGWTIWLMMLGLSATFVFQPNPLAVILSDIGWLTLILLAGRVDFNSAVAVGVQAMLVVMIGWVRPFMDITGVIKVRNRFPKRVRCRILWLAPTVLGLIFVALFFQANPVIEHWLKDVDWELITQWLKPHRFLFLVGVMFVGWMLLRPRLFPIKLKPIDPLQSFVREEAAASLLALFFNNASLVVTLFLFNALFALQNGLDVFFLWGGATLPDGLTYADYAHRGAYPLIATALLAGAFVMLVLKPGSERAEIPMIRGLVLVWLLQNVLLTVSSIWRVMLYMEAYSLTHWRFFALVWMGLVVLGLVCLLMRVLSDRGNFWLVKMNLLSLFSTLYVLAFININGLIADYNVAHCKEVTGKGVALDVSYMRDLGVDALPALVAFSENPAIPSEGRYNPLNMAGTIADVLHKDLSDWRGWTWNRARIEKIYAAHLLALKAGKIEGLGNGLSNGWQWRPDSSEHGEQQQQQQQEQAAEEYTRHVQEHSRRR